MTNPFSAVAYDEAMFKIRPLLLKHEREPYNEEQSKKIFLEIKDIVDGLLSGVKTMPAPDPVVTVDYNLDGSVTVIVETYTRRK